MSNNGEWLGAWDGEWLGPVETNPNAMSGSASFAISATGTLESAGQLIEIKPAPIFAGAVGWSRAPDDKPYKPTDPIAMDDDVVLMMLVTAFLEERP